MESNIAVGKKLACPTKTPIEKQSKTKTKPNPKPTLGCGKY
jgi:hypothetical protein